VGTQTNAGCVSNCPQCDASWTDQTYCTVVGFAPVPIANIKNRSECSDACGKRPGCCTWVGSLLTCFFIEARYNPSRSRAAGTWETKMCKIKE
jgi:hypothetical protein